MMGNVLYAVYVVRYGSPQLGVQFFGIFDIYDIIKDKMKKYNELRAGKYPAYYIVEMACNPSKMQPTPPDYYRDPDDFKGLCMEYID